jgi:hypothetical protein
MFHMDQVNIILLSLLRRKYSRERLKNFFLEISTPTHLGVLVFFFWDAVT